MAIYKIDSAHSEIQFKVRHLMITNITGSFSKYDATMETNSPDFTDAKISFEAEVSSISTGNQQRDGHLLNNDFFDAEKYPKIKFESTSIEKKSDEKYLLKGNLTMRDITKPIELDVEYGGEATDPWGQVKAGFEITGKINRKDFGLTWNGTTEAGGIMLGDEVKLMMNIEMIKQA